VPETTNRAPLSPPAVVVVIRRQLDLEQESNLTTWYSSVTLLFCALL
jgi:hypothetical protein